jgi:hypothetical protein
LRRIRSIVPLSFPLFLALAACAGREPPPPEEPAIDEEPLPPEEAPPSTPTAPPLEPGSVDGGEMPETEPPAGEPPGEGEPPDSGASAQADPLVELVGDYRYAGGKGSVNRSIDSVVSKMSVMTRGIARRRLEANNRVPKQLRIDRDGEEIVVSLDSRTYRAKPGRAKRVKNADGGTSRMRYRVVGKKLRQTFDTEDGVRTNVFTRRDDGGLDMLVTIASPRLPDRVRYRISFSPQ